MNTKEFTFALTDTEDEYDFLREYMVPAWNRFDRSDDFESGWFWRAGTFARRDLVELERESQDLERFERGTITFIVNGNPDAMVETERHYWEEFETAAVLTGWERKPFRPTYRNAWGNSEKSTASVAETGRTCFGREFAELTVELLAAFEQPLPAVGEPTDDNPVPMGFWAMIHFLMKHQGYSWYDEIDACTKAIDSDRCRVSPEKMLLAKSWMRLLPNWRVSSYRGRRPHRSPKKRSFTIHLMTLRYI